MSIPDQVRRVIHKYAMLNAGDVLVVGVSGGPDSLTLLHVLHALAPEFGVQLHVAHLDHQIRGEDSAADAAFVAEMAHHWGLPATIEARNVPAYAEMYGLAIEEAARQARYAFLAEVAAATGARKVAVGHTADDQVETVLMHFLRGSGLAGLRGMLPVSPWPLFQILMTKSQIPSSKLVLLRPLLETTRAEIESYVQEYGLQPRFDRSNLDRTLYRNRLRYELIPHLETYNPRIRDVIRRSARIFADDFDYVHQQVLAAWTHVVTETDGALTFALAPWRKLHPSLQRGLLREAIRRLRRELRNINLVHIEDALAVANDKPAGSVATLPQGLALFKSYDSFTIAEAPSRPRDLPRLAVDRIPLAVPGVTHLPETHWSVMAEIQESGNQSRGVSPHSTSPWHADVDFDRTGPHLFLRRRQPGDRFQPHGMGGHTVLLREFMINVKLPAAARDDYPLVASQEHIVWVPGYRIDERVKLNPATRRVVCLSMVRAENPEATSDTEVHKS